MACRGKDSVDPIGLMWSSKKQRKLMTLTNQRESLESTVGPVTAIVAHSRISDIRTKDPKAASKSIVKSLKGILKNRPNLKVVVSNRPPAKDPNLQTKRDIARQPPPPTPPPRTPPPELVENPHSPLSLVCGTWNATFLFTEGHHPSQN